MHSAQKQCLLRYLRYYSGAIDGIWGEGSQRATIDFQRAYMDPTEVDGIFGEATEKRILEVIATGEKPKETILPEMADWWREIKHFTRDEPYISCPCGKCGGFPVEPSESLMRLADQVREHFGAPMIPTSTVRCQAHNDSLKGSAKNSFHVKGRAMDFVIRGRAAAEVVAYVQTLDVHYTYAINANAVHMDVN